MRLNSRSEEKDAYLIKWQQHSKSRILKMN